MDKRPAYLDKYEAYNKEHGIDIIARSDKNTRALKERLKNRTLLPIDEHESYGQEMLSEKEEPFFEFWEKTITPLFTAKHGTPEKIDELIPVADRRRDFGSHKNSRTGGKSRQEFNFTVLGIGDDHPVPVSDDAYVIKINIDKISEEHKYILKGAFIGGHLADYVSTRAYPPCAFGSTIMTVKFDEITRTKTTTFKREDGTEIVETLKFKEEIVAAIPDFKNITQFLGLKCIEYLRFIGGTFQEEILNCRDPSIIAAFFKSLFLYHVFPELKLPSKIPVNTRFVEIINPNPDTYTLSYELHRAVMKGDLERVKELVLDKKVDVNLPNGYGDTAFSVLLREPQKYKGNTYKTIPSVPIFENGELVSCTPSQIIKRGVAHDEMLRFLLSQGADLYTAFYSKTALCHAVLSEDEELITLVKGGSFNPLCPSIRKLSPITYQFMGTLVKRNDLEQFEKYFPLYCENYEPGLLLFLVLKFISAQNPEKTYVSMLQLLLTRSDPNYREEKLTALMAASMEGKVEAVNILLNTPKIDINAKIETEGGRTHEYEGATALHLAVHKQQTQSVDLLVNAGANIDEVDACGRTAHHVASLILSGKLSNESKESQMRLSSLAFIFGMNPQAQNTLTNEEKTALDDILKILEDNNASTEHNEVKEIPNSRDFAAVGIVTVKCKEKLHILLIRKPNRFGDPKGRYMLPGGIKDPEDKTYCEAAIREIQEEANIDVSDAKSVLLHEFSDLVGDVECRREIFHFELPDCKELPLPFPASDVASAEWVALDDLEFKEVSETSLTACAFNGIPLRADNTMIIRKLYFDEEIETKKMNESLSTEIIIPALANGFKAIILAYDDAQITESTKKLKKGLEALIKVGMLEADQCILEGRPLIFWAAARGHGALIDWLVGLGSDINLVLPDGMGGCVTPLIALILSRDYELTKRIIEEYDVDVGYFEGHSSVLHTATTMDGTEIEFFKYLLKKVDNPTTEMIGSCFLEAVKNPNISFALELLNQFSFNLNRTYRAPGHFGPSQFLPLAVACQFPNPKLIEIMLDKSASPMVQPSTGFKNILKWAEQLRKEPKQKLNIAKARIENANNPWLANFFTSDDDESIESLEKKVQVFDDVIKLLKDHMPEKTESHNKNL